MNTFRNTANWTALLLATSTFLAPTAFAQQQAEIPEETLRQLEAKGFETDPEVFEDISTGGKPNGRWKEGLTFEGVEPMPWLTSAANWFPGKEEVQSEEIRVTFMGSSPLLRPGQMGTSVYVELGNGGSFIFDMGPGPLPTISRPVFR